MNGNDFYIDETGKAVAVQHLNKHSFCPITRYCRRCGMPLEFFTRHDVVVDCFSSSDKVVSLSWWRHLVAHKRLTSQLMQSIAKEIT